MTDLIRVTEWDATVRPFVGSAAGKRILDPINRKPATPGKTVDSSITWGQASNFEIIERKQPEVAVRGVGGIEFIKGTTPTTPPEDPPAEVTYKFTETGRKTTKVRVENPSDATQYVMVERIDEITFVGEDKIFRRFILNWR